MDSLRQSSKIATYGLKAQAERLRVISQNLANADSVAASEGQDPYRRQVITFKNVLEKDIDAKIVKTKRVEEDMTPFDRVFDPSHPAADEQGYVLAPNVNMLVELMDLREAQRSYEANLNVVTMSRELTNATLDILRS